MAAHNIADAPSPTMIHAAERHGGELLGLLRYRTAGDLYGFPVLDVVGFVHHSAIQTIFSVSVTRLGVS